jgi:hypothetical protein
MKRPSSGKKSEKEVTAHLKDLSKYPDIWYHRLPDAGVCMGRLPKQPADYLVVCRGEPTLVEVKEEKHPDKIAASRLSQASKMVRFTWAGGKAVFLIHHYVGGYWRCVPVDDVVGRTGTLDLAEYRKQTLEEAVNAIVS